MNSRAPSRALRALMLAGCVLAAHGQNIRIISQVGSSTTPVLNGGTVTISTDAVGQPTTAGISLLNVGGSTLSISRISLAGSADMTLLGVPALPATVGAGNLVNFSVQYSPVSAAAVSSTLTVVSVESGVSVTYMIQLTGTVVGTSSLPNFIAGYSDPLTDNAVAVFDGSVITFPPVAVGTVSDITVTITNRGLGSGAIRKVQLAGDPALQLQHLPLFPVTLGSGVNMQFVVHFAPTAQQAYSGTLSISFPDKTWIVRVDASGVGPTYHYSLVTGDTTTAVQPSGTISFPDTPVGDTQTIFLRIANTGTAQGQIAGITLSDPQFHLVDAPSVPIVLRPNTSVQVTLAFVPQTTGQFTARIRIGDDPFTLAGVGMALPRYRFEGASGTQDPLQQPTIGLTLAAAYPVPISGTLTLGFVSDVFSANPAVQFSTGGRTAAFTIPANSTSAVFDNAQTQVRIQTGTVAGNILITPAFTTRDGLNLTPAAPAGLSLSVARSAPKLLGGNLGARTLNSITLSLTGYTTTRALRQIDLQLNAKAGVRLDNSHLSVDLQSPSTVWFQSTNSEQFGGLFSISVPILLTGGSSSADQTANIQSVDITISNELGESNKLSVVLP